MRRFALSCAMFIIATLVFIVPSTAFAQSTYSSGDYGTCDFNSCGITLTSLGTLTADVVPTTSTLCSVAADTVTVMTNSSTGYTLMVNDTNTDNHLLGVSHGGAIDPVSGTNSSPASLTANTWGYRVDGAASFGPGPASAISSAPIPSYSFAAVPLSSGASDTIATSSAAANPAVSTSVWFGVCANVSIPGDTYSDNVTYTAVVN